MQYAIYLKIDWFHYRIPVNPQSYEIHYPIDNQRYQILDLGEIVKSGKPGLRTVKWQGVFPQAKNYPGIAADTLFAPSVYIEAIKKAETQGKPIRLVVNRYMEDGTAIFDDNFEALVEDFTVEERGGETGDFYYKITLTEYKEHLPKQVTVSSQTAITTQQRTVPSTQLVVGCKVRIDGKYWSSSEGARPFGIASGKIGKVSRIITTDPRRAYPIHITNENGGALGWVQASQVQCV